MELSVVLLWCLFILCVTRAAERAFLAFHMRLGWGAVMALLLLGANLISFQPFPELRMNPAAILICLYTGITAGLRLPAVRVMQAIALALLAGACMTALHYLHLSGRVTLFEPGLFLALCGVPFMLLMHKAPNAALFLAVLSPLLMNAMESAMDLYFFGYAVADLGSPAAFDAQVAGMILSGIMLPLFSKRTASAEPDIRQA